MEITTDHLLHLLPGRIYSGITMTNYGEKSQKAAWYVLGKIVGVTCIQLGRLFPAVNYFPALSDWLQLELTSAAHGEKISAQPALEKPPLGVLSLNYSATKPRRVVAEIRFLCMDRQNRVSGRLVNSWKVENCFRDMFTVPESRLRQSIFSAWRISLFLPL